MRPVPSRPTLRAFFMLATALALATACSQKDDPAHASAPDPVGRIDAFIAEQEQSGRINRTTDEWWRINLPQPPWQAFDAGDSDKHWFWDLKTSKGDIRIELMPEVAPNHVTNIFYLTRLGFYDGLTFHRVQTGFVIQGGCPRGTGHGSAGYAFDGEFNDSVRHDRPGWVSTANKGPGTDGSQFFILLRPAENLDGRHTIFGRVVEGWETVETIERFGSLTGSPSEKITIHEAKISVE